MLKSIRKENDGFTLVEMIVVIVILSILLAILIPGLISFIDKAKDKQNWGKCTIRIYCFTGTTYWRLRKFKQRWVYCKALLLFYGFGRNYNG